MLREQIVPRTKPTAGAALAQVAVAVINYNGHDVLPPTMHALDALIASGCEVLLIDDHSTDGSDLWVREHHRDVRIVRMPDNAGKPSAVRNRALRETTRPFLMLIDHDVVLDLDCVATLLAAMRSQPRVFCCTPRLLYQSDPMRIYLDDGGLHFLCLSSRAGRGVDVAERPAAAPVRSIGGGNMLVDREAALELGGFDEGYQFGWGEDAELPLRARLAGWQCLHVPSACALHVDRPRGKARAAAQFHNRARMMLTQYQLRTLVLLAPMLLAVEAMLLAASAAMGVTGCWWFGWRAVWRSRAEIRRRRAAVQATRRVGDGELLEASPIALFGMTGRSRPMRLAARGVDAVAQIYWWAVRPFLRFDPDTRLPAYGFRWHRSPDL